MKHLTVQEHLVDLPVVAADFLVDSGLWDQIVDAVRKTTGAMPNRLRLWLGSELRHPDNSLPPHVETAEPGPWNGVILLECDEPTYWLLVRAGERKPHVEAKPHPIGGTPPRWPDPTTMRHGRYEQRDRMNWPDQDEPWNSPFNDGELWRT